MSIKRSKSDSNFGRRPLGRLVPRSLGRVLKQGGQVKVAAFGSSV